MGHYDDDYAEHDKQDYIRQHNDSINQLSDLFSTTIGKLDSEEAKFLYKMIYNLSDYMTFFRVIKRSI